MSALDLDTQAGRSPLVPAGHTPTRERVPVDWRRLRRPLTHVALALAFIASIGAALGTIVAGRLADAATPQLLALLAVCVLGAALLDTAAKTVWATICDRAEGQLRADLLDAALDQPLTDLTEQAVGEILDRIDDDTWEVGQLLRWGVWMAARTVLATGPLWVVASLTWWPAVVLFPVTAALTWLSIRRLLPRVAELKVVEEACWTDHAAATEEGVAARDDMRTSLGQAHLLRRSAGFAAAIHRALGAVLSVEVRIVARSGLLLHALLAGTAVVGVAAVSSDRLDTAGLVTLFLVTTTFTGQVNMLASHMTDLQAGFGAVLRLRGMLAAPAEAVGGHTLPPGPLDIEFRDLHFSYGSGTFALTGVDLRVEAGHTCAVVGRTGSGKSTLASLISRAVEPAPGSVLLGGVDVREFDLQQLRAAVGVVTQRTEILAGTLADNIALFNPRVRDRVASAVADLGLTEWVEGLPAGLDTELGPGGTTLSAGEEQLVAFARLLVRDVRVVILDEATARMDPVTEARVVAAAQRLIAGRTGLLVAHRLSTTERAEQVAVLDSGRVVQHGPRTRLARTPGPFRDLLEASAREPGETAATGQTAAPGQTAATIETATPGEVAGQAAGIGTIRRTTNKPAPPQVRPAPSLARATWRALTLEPRWGLAGMALFLLSSLTGAFGAVTGWIWGHTVAAMQAGERPTGLVALLVLTLLVGPLFLAIAIRLYPQWWISVMLRVRTAVLAGQTQQHRLERTPPGEVVARTMDADRLARYADRWVDFVNGLVIVVVTALIAGSWLAGSVPLAVMVAAAVASSAGRSIAGRSAAASSTARAGFGRALVSALESVRTVKLAAATRHIHTHLRQVDGGRVDAAIKEHRVQALLDGVPVVMVQAGVIAAWAGLLTGHWPLATALLVANTVSGFEWFGRVSGSVVTEAPGARAWMRATSDLAGGAALTRLPDGVDLIHGLGPTPPPTPRTPLTTLTLSALSAVHDDGTIGVSDVELQVERGELVLLLGQVGSGKSSLLAALAGLVSSTGDIRWNGVPVSDPQSELRPGQVAHVAQVPRVLSGTFADNLRLSHPQRDLDRPIRVARLSRDVAEAGGSAALVGHRGVRLSGGQVQRLALARAVACEAELLLADDVSSALDAATEIELWAALRASGATVIGATSKAAALARADRVLVLDRGRVVDSGPWTDLQPRWRHLAG